jgi:hypothetical protein
VNQHSPIRIGIVEIYSHHVFVHTLASVARQSGMQVTIYTTEKWHRDMVPLFAGQYDDYRWEISREGESDWTFLKRIKPRIEQELDLLVINTVQGYRVGFFYFFKPTVKTIVGAGRISEFFGSRYRLFGFPSLRRMLHHNYTRYLMKRLVPRYKGIVVHTDQARAYTAEHGYDKPVIQMPFSLYKEGVVSKTFDRDTVVKFVVTGSIVSSCRDHMGVLDVFERLWDDGRRDLALTVLSNPRTPHGFKVLARMKALKDRGYGITFFEGWIAEQTYLDEAEGADFFLSPLNLNYYSSGELTSGIVEAIRQGKPGIYPFGYLPDPAIRTSSLFYNNLADLKGLIERLLNDKLIIQDYAEIAITNASQYALQAVADKFKAQIDQIMG